MDIANAVTEMYTIARAVANAGDGSLAHDIMVVADRLNKKIGPVFTEFTEDEMETIKRAT